MNPQLWLTISSPQHTTISLTITTWTIQWTIQPIDNTLYFYSWIYRTQNILQPVTITANITNNYLISWNISSTHTWLLNPPVINSSTHILYLNPWDGTKNITTQLISLDPINSGEIILLPWLQFGLDTTPPSLPWLINGPNWLVTLSDTLIFNRNAWYDWWSWIKQYIIQLSQNAHFPTAIEFITTGNTVQLSANSLEQKQWYWRLGVVDNLWNILYSNAQSFYYSTTTWGWGWSTSSINNPKPSNQTPVSDQCNGPDLSHNFFDWLCTSLVVSPQLVNVPFVHQAADKRPFREKIEEYIKNQPLKAYVFPAYDAPHAYTIYEYPEQLVYKDIYEWDNREENSWKPVIVYNPRLWIKNTGNTTNPLNNETVQSLSWISKEFNYLFIWYKTITLSCPSLSYICQIEPMCVDTILSCNNLNNQCIENHKKK